MKNEKNYTPDKTVRVTVITTESIKSMLDTMVSAYGSNMSSFINMLIMDKFTNEFLPFNQAFEEKNNM